jgi:hypothetical protein
MTVKTRSDRSTVPLGVGLLAALAIATGWFLFQGAPFVVGCLVMLALAGVEVAILVRTPHRDR